MPRLDLAGLLFLSQRLNYSRIIRADHYL